MNRILGVDIGTHMGMAVISGATAKVITHGCYHLKGKNIESPGMRFLRAREVFITEIETFEPDLVAVESVKRWMSSDAAFVYNGILAQLLVVLHEKKIDFVGYSPTEIKKAVTGKGKASKEEILQWVAKTYPYLAPITDDNEADALAICYTAYVNSKNIKPN